MRKKIVLKMDDQAIITRQPKAYTSNCSKLPVLIRPRSLSKIPTARQPQAPEKPKIWKLPIGSSILYRFKSLPADMEARAAIDPMMQLELTPTLLQEAEIETRPDKTEFKIPYGS